MPRDRDRRNLFRRHRNGIDIRRRGRNPARSDGGAGSVDLFDEPANEAGSCMRGVAETSAETGGLLCGIAVYRAEEGVLGGTTGSCGAGARAGGREREKGAWVCRAWDKNSGKGTSDA